MTAKRFHTERGADRAGNSPARFRKTCGVGRMGCFLCISGHDGGAEGKGPPPGTAVCGRGMIQGKNAAVRDKTAAMLTDGLFRPRGCFPEKRPFAAPPLTNRANWGILALSVGGAVARYHAERSYREESPGFTGQG